MRGPVLTPREGQAGNSRLQGIILLQDTSCSDCWSFIEQDWEPGEILENEDPGFTDTYLLLSALVFWGSAGLWVQGFHLESNVTGAAALSMCGVSWQNQREGTWAVPK